jgi:hypothetical protein
MATRHAIIASIFAVLLATSSFAFQARLWFKNNTTGLENSGAVLVSPGDSVSIWFQYIGSTDDASDKWGLFQATLDLAGITLITDAEASTWSNQLDAGFLPNSTFTTKILFDTDDGPMYDLSIDPTDNTQPLVTKRGLYALIGVLGNKPEAHDFGPQELFRFTVAPGALAGETLDWLFDARDTGVGLSTRILDKNASTADITDNHLQAVPEPGGLAAMSVLIGLVFLRPHRK